MDIIKKCAACGKEFTPNRGKQIYCSAKCRIKQSNMREKLSAPERKFTCQYCKKVFVSKMKKKYCSFECCTKANIKTKTKTRRRTTAFPSLSIEQINKLAREQGLTYGQYMAKVYAEELKHG